MKKIFGYIGVLIFLFSTLQFFLVIENKVVYATDDKPHMIMLESFIEASELEEIAKKNDVTLYNRECICDVLGKRLYRFNVINKKNNKYNNGGKTLFETGKKEFVFVDKNSDKRFEQILMFEDNVEKVKKTINMFESKGYKYTYQKLGEIKVTWKILQDETSIKFIILIMLLSTIVIISYYVHRLKEIGVKRLNGLSCNEISWAIIRDMILRTTIGFWIPSIIFVIWVFYKDYKLVGEYIYTCIIFFGAQFFIYVFGHIIAIIYLKKVNYISAIKNKKNNRLIYRMLLIGKVIVMVVLFIDINNAMNEWIFNKDINAGYDMVKDLKLYRLSQHVPLGEDNHEMLKREMSIIPDEDIYTYITYADDEYYSSSEIKRLVKTGKKFNVENSMVCSVNMLEKLNVKNVNGEMIKNMSLEKEQIKYLVPYKYKDRNKEIKEYYKCTDKDIEYIENNQSFMSYTIVGEYWFDAIICVCNVEKSVSQNTLLTENGKKIMEGILKKTKLSGDNIGITSLEEINREMRDSSNVEMIYILVNVFISIMSYIVITISIIIIYFEMNKKQIGVYTLLGRTPTFEIIFFIVCMICCVSFVAFNINYKLLIFNFIEIIIYLCILSRYLKNKAILAIKGE